MPHARPRDPLDRLDPRICLPLLAAHLGVLAVVWTGWSPMALAVAALLLWGRAFGLTAGYHRYFSHRSFRTSRGFQLALAVLGASAAQLGPLWWASHHRAHHRFTDRPGDPHSPATHGLWWAHMGWLLCRRHASTNADAVRDLVRFPELRWLDRLPWLAPLLLVASLYALGEGLAHLAPGLATDGAMLVAWGFFASTVALYHLTFAVNSLGHRRGAQPHATGDQSRNHAVLGWLALGDGWHNHHHRFPASARHGLGPGEVDLTWLALRGLERLGLVWGLRSAPTSQLPPTRRRASPGRALAERLPGA